MTRMTGPDCAVMCNLINIHTHTQRSVLSFRASALILDTAASLKVSTLMPLFVPDQTTKDKSLWIQTKSPWVKHIQCVIKDPS